MNIANMQTVFIAESDSYTKAFQQITGMGLEGTYQNRWVFAGVPDIAAIAEFLQYLKGFANANPGRCRVSVPVIMDIEEDGNLSVYVYDDYIE